MIVILLFMRGSLANTDTHNAYDFYVWRDGPISVMDYGPELASITLPWWARTTPNPTTDTISDPNTATDYANVISRDKAKDTYDTTQNIFDLTSGFKGEWLRNSGSHTKTSIYNRPIYFHIQPTKKESAHPDYEEPPLLNNPGQLPKPPDFNIPSDYEEPSKFIRQLQTPPEHMPPKFNRPGQNPPDKPPSFNRPVYPYNPAGFNRPGQMPPGNPYNPAGFKRPGQMPQGNPYNPVGFNRPGQMRPGYNRPGNPDNPAGFNRPGQMLPGNPHNPAGFNRPGQIHPAYNRPGNPNNPAGFKRPGQMPRGNPYNPAGFNRPGQMRPGYNRPRNPDNNSEFNRPVQMRPGYRPGNSAEPAGYSNRTDYSGQPHNFPVSGNVTNSNHPGLEQVQVPRFPGPNNEVTTFKGQAETAATLQGFPSPVKDGPEMSRQLPESVAPADNKTPSSPGPQLTTPTIWRPGEGYPDSFPGYDIPKFGVNDRPDMARPEPGIVQVTTTALPPMVVAMKKDMVTSNRGYFTAFLIKLFALVALKPRREARELSLATVSVVYETEGQGKIRDFGEPFVSVLVKGANILSIAPTDVVQSQAAEAHQIMLSGLVFDEDVVNIIKILDANYVIKEGDKLLTSLVDIDEYPKGNKTAKEVMTNVFESVIAPYYRLKSSERIKIFFSIINEFVMTRYPSIPIRKSGTNNRDGKGYEDDRRYLNDYKDKCIGRGYKGARCNGNQKRYGQDDKRETHRTEKGYEVKHRYHSNNKTISLERLKNGEDKVKTKQNDNRKPKQGDFRNKVKQIIMQHVQSEYPEQHGTFKNEHKVVNEKTAHKVKLDEFNYEKLLKNRFMQDMIVKSIFDDISREARLKKSKPKLNTNYTSLKKHHTLQKRFNIVHLDRNTKSTELPKHQKIITNSDGKTKYSKESNSSRINTNQDGIKPNGKDNGTEENNRKKNKNLTKDKNKDNVITRINRNKDKYINNIGKGIPNTSWEKIIKNMVKFKANIDSNEDLEEEKELKFNLGDAARHGDRKFNYYERKSKVNNKINELSSYSDEEGVLKNNIYKVFGYDPDIINR